MAQSTPMGWWAYRKGIFAALILIFMILFALVIWKVPVYQVDIWAAKQSAKDTISIKDLADLEDKFRKTLVQLLGGTVAGIAALLTALNALKKRFDISQDTVYMERFVRAVDQLGATDESGMKKLEIRIGGIYALERVAWDSPSDHGPIMEILTAYVREHASRKGSKKLQKSLFPESKQRQSDIQAIIEVVRRRRHLEKENQGQVLNFVETDLMEANLTGAHLSGADFSNSNLELANLSETTLRETKFIGAQLPRASLVKANAESANFGETNLEATDLTDANLNKAQLRSANLHGANLINAQLNEANLINANLSNVKLMRAQLKKADLINTDFKDAYLFEADMEMANLRSANLEKAYLMGCNLESADLSQANLKKANLAKAKMRKVRNLSVDQISVAKTLFQAELEPELLNTIKDKYPHLLKKPE